MKTKFKYKFTPMFIVLFVAGLLLATGCIIRNSIDLANLIASGKGVVYNYISKILTIIIGILAYVFILPAIISSNYQIKDGQFISKWGIILSKLPIDTMTKITVFRKTDKLVIYFTDESYLNVCIDKSLFDEFIDAIKTANPKVFYTLETDVDVNKK